MEVSGQLQTPAVLSPRKKSRYPLDKRLGWLQSQSEEEKNLLTCQESNSDSSAVQSVARFYTD
jgi:hypothetical protein